MEELLSGPKTWMLLTLAAAVAGWGRAVILERWRKQARKIVKTTFSVLGNPDIAGQEVTEASRAWYEWWRTGKGFKDAIRESKDVYMAFSESDRAKLTENKES